jgi:predicted enzyme related to lactoylglutathione lyase
MRIHFSGIILFVQDVQKLATFYTQLFGFTLAEAIESEWALLKAGNVELGLHKSGAAYPVSNAGESFNESNTKLIFETEEDIIVFHKELVTRGVRTGEIKTWDNFPYRLFDGKDPEGNVFQVRQKKQ